MIRVYADFNDRTPEGGYWILQHDGADIEACIEQLGLSVGDRVLLYQDEGDFEVTARLSFDFVGAIGRKSWIAFPDWDTMTRATSVDAAHSPGTASGQTPLPGQISKRD
jgi:hypothetical protein